MELRKPKILSYHGFRHLMRTQGTAALNQSETLRLIGDAAYIALRYKNTFILFFTRSGAIKIPYTESITIKNLINNYLPDEYELVKSGEENYKFALLEKATNTKITLVNCICILNDRAILTDEEAEEHW